MRARRAAGGEGAAEAGGAMARSAEGAALLLLVSAGSGDAAPRAGEDEDAGGRRARALTCPPAPERSPAPDAPSLCREVGKGWAGCGEPEPRGFGKVAGSPRACGNPPEVLLCWPPPSGPSASSGCGPWVSWARSTFPGDPGFVCSLLPPTGNMDAGETAAVPSCGVGRFCTARSASVSRRTRERPGFLDGYKGPK